MNKKLTIRIMTAVAVAFLFSAGILAQTPIPGYTDGGGSHNYDSTGATQVTLGKSIPVMARPDLYFHPSYNAEDGTGLTAGFFWDWVPVAGTGSVTIADSANNYTRVIGATLGTASVTVAERGPNCADATPETINLTVIATPSFSITSPAADITECVGAPNLAYATSPVVATIAANGASQYRLVWTLAVHTESAGAPDEWFDSDLSTSLGVALAYAEEYTQAIPQSVAASGAHTITSTAGTDFVTINNKTTVYTYTLTAINDLVSRRSDFITISGGTGGVQGAANPVNTATPGSFMYYDIAGVNPLATTDQVVITVHPVPVTGPIYHISNTWAN
jgi:hypothetical protein